MGFLCYFVECVVVHGLRVSLGRDEFVGIIVVWGHKLSVGGHGGEICLHWSELESILQRDAYIREACCQQQEPG